MKYWKITTPTSMFTYEFATSNDVKIEEIKKWFVTEYSAKKCKVREVDKSEIDSLWVIRLERKDNGFTTY